mmetsp:Transcript_10800/g.44710  ORF Transcript_10800/g.44710 Transcript_10800/m.44710 type:complete len:210 (+) Transcript_10800:2338-2967(+)
MSLRLRSAACSARRTGSMMAPRSATRGAALPFALRSHARPRRGIGPSVGTCGTSRSMTSEVAAHMRPRASRTHSRRILADPPSGAQRAPASVSRLRTGHDATPGSSHGSKAATSRRPLLASLPSRKASPASARLTRAHEPSSPRIKPHAPSPPPSAPSRIASVCAARHSATASASAAASTPQSEASSTARDASSWAGCSSAKHGAASQW